MAGVLSKLESDIVQQIEYYFGDMNLLRDKFLLEQIEKDSEGWVSLSVLITFKRLAALSTEFDVILNALRKSHGNLLEVDENGMKVRRNPKRPLPETNDTQLRKEIHDRSASVTGFPLDTQMADLIDFFSPYEKIVNISMCKSFDKSNEQRKFNGSVIVTFEKAEQTQKFIESVQLPYKDRPLLRKWQPLWLAEKREERKRERELAAVEKFKPGAVKRKIELPKGTVVHFKCTGTRIQIAPDQLRRAIVKVSNEWKIAQIHFCKGDKEGHIRFEHADTAPKFIQQLKSKMLKIKDGVVLNMRTLPSVKEKEFLNNAAQSLMNRQKRK